MARLRAFHRFPDLPFELRAQIWGAVVGDAPRVHRINVIEHHVGVWQHEPPSLCASSTHAILTTCHEARAECIRHLPNVIPLNLIGGRHVKPGGFLRYNAERDVVCIVTTQHIAEKLDSLSQLVRDTNGEDHQTAGPPWTDVQWLHCEGEPRYWRVATGDEWLNNIPSPIRLPCSGRDLYEMIWMQETQRLAIEAPGNADPFEYFCHHEVVSRPSSFVLPRFFALFPSLKHFFVVTQAAPLGPGKLYSQSTDRAEQQQMPAPDRRAQDEQLRRISAVGGLYLGERNCEDWYAWAPDIDDIMRLPVSLGMGEEWHEHVMEVECMLEDIEKHLSIVGDPIRELFKEVTDDELKRWQRLNKHTLVHFKPGMSWDEVNWQEYRI